MSTLNIVLQGNKKLELTVDLKKVTINGLKELLESETGVAPHYQRLIFSGREIMDSDKKTCAKAGIGANNVFSLHMMARPGAAAAAAPTEQPSTGKGKGKSKAPPAAEVIDLDDEPPAPRGRGRKAAPQAQARNSRAVIDLADDSPASSTSAAAGKKRAAPASSSSAPAEEEKKKAPARQKRKTTASSEKRLHVWRGTRNQDVQARIMRAQQQRMYLIHRGELVTEPEISCSFGVLGSTGNLYTVRICKIPTCDCPDCTKKGNLCKHVLFVFLKVLKVPIDSMLIHQKALLQDELREIFARAPAANDSLANQRAVAAFREIVGLDEPNEGASAEANAKDERAVDADEDCPICYELLLDGTALAQCQLGCKKSLHKECMSQWTLASKAKGHQVLCPYCRAPFSEAGGGGGGAAAQVNAEGYLNLAHLTGQSPQRDTSTYSPWLNRRGGW